jgi:4-amino-4-deoxy-L-arabinose transferase-like glycosyltransferase
MRALDERSRERVVVCLLAALAGVLLLANLGNQYLWQDEAQTALLARTVLSAGVPLGYDGRNHFSQELGVEYGEDGIWKWHTWLSFYLVAGFFALLGPGTFSARLPFALCGVACVLLTYATARSFWRDRHAATAAALLLALCVPFLVLSRQCRYYSLAALLCLAALWAYRRLAAGGRSAPWILFAAATLLFHTHYVYVAGLLASLLLHAWFSDRARFRTTLWISAAVTLLALPWIVWFSTIRLTPEKTARLLDWSDTLVHAGHYVRLLARFFFAHGAFLLIPAFLALRRRLRGQPVFELQPETRSLVGLLLLFCGLNIVVLSLLSPLVYVRYLTPLAPPLFLLAGLFVGSLWRVSRAAGVVVVAAFVAFGSLRDFAHELVHDYDGPIEGIVEFLQRNARPDDVVAMVYGDLPVKFYTDLRVVGGLTGEDLEAARGADWIILRHHVVAPVSREVRAVLRSQISPREYRRYVLDYPETAFENREDPREHRFRSAQISRRVEIWGRRR